MNRRDFFGALSGLLAGWLGKDALNVEHLRPFSGPVDLLKFTVAVKGPVSVTIPPAGCGIYYMVFDGQKWQDNEASR